MKKDASCFPFDFRVIRPISSSLHYGLIKVDVHNFFFRNSRVFRFRRVTSSRNSNYGKCYFRYDGDTYYFDP